MRRTPLIAALTITVATALVAGACGSDDASDTSTPASVEGVGVVPPTLVGGGGEASGIRPHINGGGSDANVASPADGVGGNHVVVIGDSLMESTTVRYGAAMCNSLVPRGWAVEIFAEEGRHVDYGIEVLDGQSDPEWDVAAVMLGNNYRGNQAAYEERLEEIVQRLSPLPIVMFTVTEFESAQVDVNESIWRVADRHDNITIIDWNAETTGDPSLLAGDGLHLTETGRNRLAALIGEHLGEAPGGSVGDCLDDDYFDDSIATVPPALTIPPTTTPSTTTPPTLTSLPSTTSFPSVARPPSFSPPTTLPLRTTSPFPITSSTVTGPPATYQIQPGDALERIAIDFGVTVEELASLNGIADVDQIRTGQIIELPPTAIVPSTTPG